MQQQRLLQQKGMWRTQGDAIALASLIAAAEAGAEAEADVEADVEAGAEAGAGAEAEAEAEAGAGARAAPSHQALWQYKCIAFIATSDDTV